MKSVLNAIGLLAVMALPWAIWGVVIVLAGPAAGSAACVTLPLVFVYYLGLLLLYEWQRRRGAKRPSETGRVP